MRKINPNDVRTDFSREVDDVVAYFNRVVGSLAGSPHELGDITRLAETTFLTVFVGFERFLSDLFLAYLNRQFGAYRADLEGRVRQSTQERFGAWASQRTRLDRVQHVRVADLENIVDPQGRNLTFPSAQDIKEKAQRWLSAAHNARIQGLSAHDDRVIDTARAIRDFIAHRSKAALDAMNGYLATVTQGPHNPHLGRGANDIHSAGFFLKTVFVAERRVVLYATRLRDISGVM